MFMKIFQSCKMMFVVYCDGSQGGMWDAPLIATTVCVRVKCHNNLTIILQSHWLLRRVRSTKFVTPFKDTKILVAAAAAASAVVVIIIRLLSGCGEDSS